MTLAWTVLPANAVAPELSCDLAASKAERDWNLPAGILAAVGTVESGKASARGLAPWPWTINAAGRGSHQSSKGDAIATVLAIMAQGYPFIDVGCFQVDIAYHPGIFRSLDDAFDPDRNAQAAAQILLRHRIAAPDWATAVARYHSATPERGGQYLQRVRDALPAARFRARTAEMETDPGGTGASTSKASAAETRPLPTVIYGLPIDETRPPATTRLARITQR